MLDIGATQMLLRLFLGSVLVVAGIAKARKRTSFERTLVDWGLRPAQVIALVVITSELVLGMALLAGLALPIAAIATFALLGLFTMAALWQLVRKREAACNCFGFLQSLGPDVLLRNVGLMILALEVGVIGSSTGEGLIGSVVLRIWPVATWVGIALVAIASWKIAKIEQRAAPWRSQ